MGTLAQDVMGGAQDAVNQQGHTMGDAIAAYHVTATAEHARQELEMQKQDQEMNKAKWFAQTVDQINRSNGPAQKILIDAMVPQIKQVYPNFDVRNIDLMKKDPDFAQKLNQVMGNIVNHPGDVKWGDLNNMIQQTAPELWKNVDTAVQADANRVGKMAMAQAMAQKNQAFEDKNQLNTVGQYNQVFRPIEDTITSANRVMGIIDRIQKGELKSTPTLTTDLSMALAGMLNKGSAATVSGTEHAGEALQSLAGNAAQKYGFVAGQPMNTVTPAQLSQLRADVSALKGEYSAARKNVFGRWSAQIPQNFVAPITAGYNAFNENASAAPSQPQQAAAAPQAPANPIPYGASESDIKKNYQLFKAHQAHQAVGVGGQQQAGE